jgi:hypothetical protein
MDLVTIGERLLERAETRVGSMICRCLGFTAMSLQILLDEVQNNGADERWGVEQRTIVNGGDE